MMIHSEEKNTNKYIQQNRLSADLKEAANVQSVLLQHEPPACESLECKGVSIPAHYLGGDYYGFIFEEEKQKYWVFTGDVMGKGIPAFAKMAMLRTAIRTLVPQSSGPSDLLQKVNMILYEDLKLLKSFATLFCGMYDLAENTFTYASAGHPSAILKREKHPSEFLKANGIAIGFLPNRKYIEERVILGPNDYVCIYTDGILEAMDNQRNQFGKDRIIKMINQHSDYSSLVKTITEHVLSFSNFDQRDDVTLVTIRRMAH
jgi:phosphoserine phosphatase RsbU/P